MSWVVAITIFVAVTAFLVWASADVRSGIYLGMLCRTTTHRRVVALTFDDGPDAEETPRVLDVLKRHGVRATFFVVGERIEAHPELLLRMLSEGHTIGNHTALIKQEWWLGDYFAGYTVAYIGTAIELGTYLFDNCVR